MSELTCPKCRGIMRTYERSGVAVDQCTECRGIFLDRGELERLIDAEAAWSGAPLAPVPPRQHYERQQPSREQDRQHPYKKRRRSFFEELFD